MDSKAMADSFLDALQLGAPQPAAQNASAAGAPPDSIIYLASSQTLFLCEFH